MIKVLSLFSGIGAFERACCRIGLDWELVNYCEIDAGLRCRIQWLISAVNR